MGAAAAVAGIGAAASIGAGLMQSSAIGGASDAANARANQARGDLQPWTTTGANALGITADLSGANGPDAATKAMANYQTSPGYQWQLGQGLRAVDAGAAAKGMLRSGATLKGEQEYGAGLANQDFGNYYQRLYNLSNQGQNSAAGQGAASLNAAQTDTSAGVAQAGIYGNTAAGLGNIANNYANQSLYQTRTNALYGGGTVYGSGGDSLNYGANRAAFGV